MVRPMPAAYADTLPLPFRAAPTPGRSPAQVIVAAGSAAPDTRSGDASIPEISKEMTIPEVLREDAEVSATALTPVRSAERYIPEVSRDTWKGTPPQLPDATTPGKCAGNTVPAPFAGRWQWAYLPTAAILTEARQTDRVWFSTVQAAADAVKTHPIKNQTE